MLIILQIQCNKMVIDNYYGVKLLSLTKFVWFKSSAVGHVCSSFFSHPSSGIPAILPSNHRYQVRGWPGWKFHPKNSQVLKPESKHYIGCPLKYSGASTAATDGQTSLIHPKIFTGTSNLNISNICWSIKIITLWQFSKILNYLTNLDNRLGNKLKNKKIKGLQILNFALSPAENVIIEAIRNMFICTIDVMLEEINNLARMNIFLATIVINLEIIIKNCLMRN